MFSHREPERKSQPYLSEAVSLHQLGPTLDYGDFGDRDPQYDLPSLSESPINSDRAGGGAVQEEVHPGAASPAQPGTYEPLLHMMPVEIISGIMNYLSPSSALFFSLASKRLHTICAITSAKKLIDGHHRAAEKLFLSKIAGDRASHGDSIGADPQDTSDNVPQKKEFTDPFEGLVSHRDRLFYAKVMAKRVRLESDIRQLHLDSGSNASMQLHCGSQWSES
ncbi:hypothetical protein MMC28_005822 [Mycoblastus sanguinarius]|nr:hypothetical protein [Mycoblastus sanguinarius]